MAEIIDGRLVSQITREKIKAEASDFIEKTGVIPGIAVIIVGEDPASLVYVRNKHKACKEVGFNSFEICLPEDISEEELLLRIGELNLDSKVHGILVQLPLPRHICEKNVIEAIDKNKDVDAFHPFNIGKMFTSDYTFLPCTPAGIMTLLDFYNIKIEGKRCAVIGRSNIVGKPMALLLTERNGTVTLCHSKTPNLTDITLQSDIIVVAIGRAEFLKGDMIKEGAVVIDVGINRLPDGKLVGDAEFGSVFEKASYLTPVPGGVGPMTITTLLRNTLTAAKKSVNF